MSPRRSIHVGIAGACEKQKEAYVLGDFVLHGSVHAGITAEALLVARTKHRVSSNHIIVSHEEKANV